MPNPRKVFFRGSVKLPKIDHVNTTLVLSDGRFLRADLSTTTTTRHFYYGVAELVGLGDPHALLKLMARRETWDVTHEWAIQITPPSPGSRIPTFEMFRDGEPYTMVPAFLEDLKLKAEEICAKVLGKCVMTNFTAERTQTDANATDATNADGGGASLDTDEDALLEKGEPESKPTRAAPARLTGQYTLGMAVGTEVLGQELNVTLSIVYDADSKSFSASGTSESEISGVFGVDGLTLSPQELSWSTAMGLTLKGQGQFKSFDAAQAVINLQKEQQSVELSMHTSERKVVESIAEVVGLGSGGSMWSMLDDQAHDFAIAFNRKARTCPKKQPPPPQTSKTAPRRRTQGGSRGGGPRGQSRKEALVQTNTAAAVQGRRRKRKSKQKTSSSKSRRRKSKQRRTGKAGNKKTPGWTNSRSSSSTPECSGETVQSVDILKNGEKHYIVPKFLNDIKDQP